MRTFPQRTLTLHTAPTNPKEEPWILKISFHPRILKTPPESLMGLDDVFKAFLAEMEQDALAAAELEQSNNQTRRHIQWAVGQSDLAAGPKTFLQAVLLRMSSTGDPSTAGYDRLALDTSFSIARVYHYAKLTEESGFLERHRISRNRTRHLRVIVTPEILDRAKPSLHHRGMNGRLRRGAR